MILTQQRLRQNMDITNYLNDTSKKIDVKLGMCVFVFWEGHQQLHKTIRTSGIGGGHRLDVQDRPNICEIPHRREP